MPRLLFATLAAARWRLGGALEASEAVEGSLDVERQMCAHPTHPECRGVPFEDAERQLCARPTLLGEVSNALGDVHIRVTAPRETVRLLRTLLCRVRLAVERKTGELPSEAEGFAVLLAHALESWGVDDRRLRRQLGRRLPVFERDGWRCTVPGCSSRRNLQAHHIVFRSAGGDDSEANQTTLCAFHHQRGVHGRTLRVTGQAPAELCFELGTRAGRQPLVRYRSGDRLVA